MDNQVEIAVAAQASQLSVVRVSVAAVGAGLDMGVDRLDDLQLAVEELCIALVELGGTDDRLRVSIEWDESDVLARCQLVRRVTSSPGATDDTRSQLSRQILDALVDDHGESDDGAVATRWLRTSRAGDAPR
jgi:hypothetical protein